MWMYKQRDHVMLHDGLTQGFGYSGCGADKNDPACEEVKGQGPIPCGTYTIGDSYTDLDRGPIVLPLHPDPSNEMFHRGGFLIHGDSVAHPGCASHGCIILGHNLRLLLSISPDRLLEVIP